MSPRSALSLLCCGAAVLATAAPAAAASDPLIHAHRGGSFVGGKATYAESTLPAFRAAAARGDVLELDIGVTSDGVPVVLHDATLDRTTACTGELRATTLAALARCPADRLGSPGSVLGGRRTAKTVPIPTLASVLALAKRTKATVNAELKDFDADGSRVGRALDVLAAARLPRKQLIVQSFLPPNLDLARRALPGVATSRLTLKATNAAGIDAARTAGDAWVSPQWPITAAYVRRAHAAGVKVVPFTLDRPAAVRAAAKAGVDALITDDPAMARKALR